MLHKTLLTMTAALLLLSATASDRSSAEARPNGSAPFVRRVTIPPTSQFNHNVTASDTTQPAADLTMYIGTYSSKELPIKITVRVEKGALEAQGTGQPAFTLEASGKDTFRFEPAGIELQFEPAKKQFTLNQRGRSILFTRE